MLKQINRTTHAWQHGQDIAKRLGRRLGHPLSLTAAALMAFAAPQTATAKPDGTWVGAWASAPSDLIAPLAIEHAPPFADMTLRSTLRLTVGGDAIRVRISNALGTTPLKIGAVSLRRRGGGQFATLLFAGQGEVTIAPGQSVVSDALPITVKPLEDVQVSIYVPEATPRLTGHAVGRDPAWIEPGNQTARPEQLTGFPAFSPLLLAEVDVRSTEPAAGTIAAVGDSLTDGYLSSFDRAMRWTDVLATRLQRRARRQTGIVNLGISGNRLLQDGDGLAVLHRLDRDLWSVPGLRAVVLFIGVNDLGHAVLNGTPTPTAEMLIAGYRQVIAQAHGRHLPIVGATIPPYGRAYYHDAKGEAVRKTVNAWIRTSGEFDAVADLDPVCSDDGSTPALSAACDGGDGLHLSDGGYALVAGAMEGALDRATAQALAGKSRD